MAVQLFQNWLYPALFFSPDSLESYFNIKTCLVPAMPGMKGLRKYGKPPYSIAVIHGGPGASGEMAAVVFPDAARVFVEKAGVFIERAAEAAEVMRGQWQFFAVLAGVAGFAAYNLVRTFIGDS